MLKPEEVKAKAEKLEDENNKFRAFLEGSADGKELDEQFIVLHEELFASYDCCDCTNCCRIYTVLIENDELSQIAAYLDMTESAVIAMHLEKAAFIDANQHRIKEMPCSFLYDDGRCKIYECRPADCKNYPFTDHPDRLSHFASMITMSGVCPVVFEIIERLKMLYGFK